MAVILSFVGHTKSTGLWGCIKRGHLDVKQKKKPKEAEREKERERRRDKEEKGLYKGKKNQRLFFI